MLIVRGPNGSSAPTVMATVLPIGFRLTGCRTAFCTMTGVGMLRAPTELIRRL
jgi:hypothetical protein